MASQATSAKPGEYWVYRLRDANPSERVLIKAVDCTKSKPKIFVTFDDGRQETVPGNRIRVPWTDVDVYDRVQEAWARIRGEDSLDEVERDCINQVFDLLVPTEVAELGWRPVNDTTNVNDPEILSIMLGLDLGKYAEHYSSVDVDGALVLSPHGLGSHRRAPLRNQSNADTRRGVQGRRRIVDQVQVRKPEEADPRL